MNWRLIDRKVGPAGIDVILCELPGNAQTPWVTWKVSSAWPGHDTAILGRFWGNYHQTEGAARSDFIRRTC